ASPTHVGYVATVDFTVEAKTSRIRGAKVVSLAVGEGDPPTGDQAKPPDPPGAQAGFRACIQDALDHSALPADADKDGPGFATPDDLPVKSFRVAFLDASSKKRELASEHQAFVLIGPRADRCQGLYSHDPPRDASALYAAISQAAAQEALY